ncbi:phthalate transporter [Lentinula edodes]|uniref:Phthalate transporter n=1 Tax=Lentinula edodes TaxID=5353 RepID=A0A1Q3EI82_LENED|nr:phthalate transporter [Lentinula edodes]
MVRKDIWNPFCVAFILQIINLICCVILMTVKQPIVRYVFILIARSASNTVVNILWPSRVAALKGTTAVGLGIALSNVLSNIDGLIGPLIFSTVYGPSYHVSQSAFIICLTFFLSSNLVYIVPESFQVNILSGLSSYSVLVPLSRSGLAVPLLDPVFGQSHVERILTLEAHCIWK